MSEQAEFSKADRLELEIDTRLADIMVELLNLNIVTPDTARAFILDAYQRGVDNVITAEHPDLSSQLGYALPNSLSPGLPPWYRKMDYVPTDDEIIEHFEKRWKFSVDNLVQEPKNIPPLLRGAYGIGYVYAFATHRVRGY